MASKDQLEKEFGGDFDAMLQLFVHEFEDLIKGVPFFCTHLDQVVTVVAAFHGVEADLPERAKMTGFKNPNNCLGQYCPVCEGVKEDLPKELNSGIIPVYRNPEVFYQKVLDIMRTPNGLFRDALLAQNGLARISSKERP